MRMVLCLTVLAATVLATTARGAEPKTAPAPRTTPTAQQGPKAAAFASVLADWKKLMAELWQLKEEHASATPERKKAIVARYSELVAKGMVLQADLSKAAEAAYAENPGADKELEKFLLLSCSGNIRMDNYEDALRQAELMLKNKCEEKNLYVWAGIAAYCVGELDKAEKYLTTAADKGAKVTSGNDNLDGMIMGFLQEPGKYKEDWKKEQAIREAEAKANDLPRVLLKTNKGDIEIELFENEAPIATANFISLVEKGFYNGLGFHRVLEGFMAQGGCPKGDGTGGPGYNIPCECYKPGYRKHFRGSLSMAHAGRDTGGSQFFLTFVPTSFLDGKHTVFGRVVNGMDVLGKLQRRDPSEPKATLPPPDKIIEAKVLRKRPHEYVPKKAGR